MSFRDGLNLFNCLFDNGVGLQILTTLVTARPLIAAHSVYHMFSLYIVCIFVILVVSHFGFEGGTLVLIASVPDYCLPFCLL